MRRLINTCVVAMVTATPILGFSSAASATSCITQRIPQDGDLGGVSGKIFYAYGSHPTEGRQVNATFMARGETLSADVRLEKYEYVVLLEADGTIIEQLEKGQKYKNLDLPENMNVYLEFKGGIPTCKRKKLRT
ncbi:hypothetical protein ABGB18_42770 [Nonomuraea sp. B12E4]|uniref:hypothetical protein n=1 Tax=Nonomuraea sp. B12E4 TaxID=3153564 RepID=UPI00325CFC37